MAVLRAPSGIRRDATAVRGVYVDLPELERLGHAAQGIDLRAAQPAYSILGGRHASRLRGRGLDFEELRAYQPGDDVRAIDWRVTARARSAFVRVYREEKERPVLIVVDQRESMFFGSVRDLKSVTAAHAAAVVASRVVSGGDKAGALIFGDARRRLLPPERSQRQVRQILGALCDFNRALGQAPPAPPSPAALDEALAQVLRLSPHGYLVLLISDLFGSGPETRRLSTEIRQKNDLVLFMIHDPLEATLPDVGRAVLGDGRVQIEVDTGSAAVRERFAADVAGRRQKAAALALRYDVPYLPLSTDEAVTPQLRRLLGRHRPAGRR